MIIKGIGTDLVLVKRIGKIYLKYPSRFLNRIFTAYEKETFLSRGSSVNVLAARFAAKEAVLKALGCGIGPAALNEVEIISTPGKQPSVKLYGKAMEIADEKNIDEIFISMSHEKNIACAFATATTRF